MGNNELLKTLSKAVVKGSGVKGLFQDALAEQISAEEILKEALMPAIKEVGLLMQEEEFAFPEVQSAMKSLNQVLDELRKDFEGETPSSEVPVWEGEGELYLLGGYLVEFMEKGSGFTGCNLIALLDECSNGLLKQVDLPCHKQAESTHKE